MRILVVTSCTGQKSVEHSQALTMQDFEKGAEHVGDREQSLAQYMTPASELYTGQQHVRLMRGVDVAKSTLEIDLHVLSAGYGVVHAGRKLAPYECTFGDMKSAELRNWANSIGVPKSIRKVLAGPYDLGLVLLGDSYLRACALDESVELGGPTIFFAGKGGCIQLA